MKLNFFITLSIVFLMTACKDGKKYHDDKKEIKATSENIKTELSKEAQALAFQKEINEEYADPKESPLTKEDFIGFESLEFFPIDTSFNVVAKLELTPNEQPFLMPTTTDRKSEEVLFGILYFELHGKKFSLNVYQNLQLKETEEYKDYLFLPFADTTNGEETYGGGRYIDLRIPETDSITIDFNKAYNPYCAYNKKYSCPIVPKENTLDYAITAGVKKFKSH
ncbi:Protein of unknown function (DUF1684) [Galbibacter orientalis DSM 19592]|uniref:DUF1684 domain-containing protein n=1 Tax=Galbibacter orientalis DSM 19592 TaxID=926559 RepID=I3C741_9FLAO|nr:DUF1684 domain-containing protein [Galbibacter orientalis]EIJ39434.1 Protein of unknown function (DUF1684) [Galbibacter orientalis DSM 19592]